MEYRQFCNEKVSALGFGMMRLPVLENKEIDMEQVGKMVDMAIKSGVNYFDTAYPYMDGKSELVAGEVLSKYPRESYFLADKYPGHQTADSYDPAVIFEEQLKKCKVEYFDFYLLHNWSESSNDVYEDPKWGILDYFVEQRRLGRIKHLGFSSHARKETLKKILEKYADELEFCQLQINYLDWTLQEAKEKYDMVTASGLPIIVMEPIRGGKLAKLSDEAEKVMRQMRPNDSTAAWSFRWIKDLENVGVVLSGMSNMDQMADNIKTFSDGERLTKEQKDLIEKEADAFRNMVPCTGCGYCKAGCPMQLDIPILINLYNDSLVHLSFNISMYLENLPEDKLPSACIGCGNCMQICPQGIKIPEVLNAFDELIPQIPSWKKVCEERARIAAASK